MKRLYSLFPIPCIALACFMSGQAGGYAAEPPKIRLSGTVVTPAERTAVIEYEDGRSKRVRPGDVVKGWGRVTDIGHDRMDLESPGGSKVMLLSGRSGVVMLPPEPGNEAVAAPPAITSTASPELVAEIERLANRETAVGNDLNYTLAPLLDLPPSARIVAVDHQPLSADNTSIKHIHQALDQGIMVRLSIEGGAGLDAVYLGPPYHQAPAP